MDGDEDPELAAALAASLEEHHQSQQQSQQQQGEEQEPAAAAAAQQPPQVRQPMSLLVTFMPKVGPVSAVSWKHIDMAANACSSGEVHLLQHALGRSWAECCMRCEHSSHMADSLSCLCLPVRACRLL
jgi:hypothetical protein